MTYPFEEMQSKKSIWSSFSTFLIPTSILRAQTAEHKLLSKMPFFKSVVSSKTIETVNDDLRNQNQYPKACIGHVNIGDNQLINTLLIETQKNSTKTLVMTHGYGAGLGFYYRCFTGLANLLGYRYSNIL